MMPIKDWNSRLRRFGGSVNLKTLEIGEASTGMTQERKKTANER